MTERGAAGPLAYAPEEAAELGWVSPSFIRSLVRSGVLPRVAGLGRAMRIPSRALFEFVREPVPDLPAALVVSPSEVPEPRPAAPARTPPVPRVAREAGQLGRGDARVHEQHPGAALHDH